MHLNSKASVITFKIESELLQTQVYVYTGIHVQSKRLPFVLLLALAIKLGDRDRNRRNLDDLVATSMFFSCTLPFIFQMKAALVLLWPWP